MGRKRPLKEEKLKENQPLPRAEGAEGAYYTTPNSGRNPKSRLV